MARSDLVSEVKGADFGDKRLEKRLSKIVVALAEAPDESFPTLLDDSELEAAYRFFNNEDVDPDAILAPHIQATLQRVKDYETVLVIHDTTTMSFGAHREGLGRIRTSGHAFFAHYSLAVSPVDRLPLGVLAMTTIVRDKKKGTVTGEKKRWEKQIHDVEEHAKEPGRFLHVTDREGDIYDLLVGLSGRRERFVVRMAQNRLLDELGEEKLRDRLVHATVRAEREVTLSSRREKKQSPAQRRTHPIREGRDATLEISAIRLTIRRPVTREKSLPSSLDVNVVHVLEPNPPAGESPVEWILYTSEPIDSKDAILRVVDAYRARWVIEEFFKALKTGCAFEKRQLESFDALVNALATLTPLAWNLLRIRSLARLDCDAPASTMLSDLMLTMLALLPRAKFKQREPTRRDAFMAIARLGGFLKHNGEPGWIILGRGYEKLRTLTEGAALATGQSAGDV